MDIDRQEMLLLWIARQGLSKAELARRMQTSQQHVARLLRAETIPPWRYDQFRKLGVPEELLPRPQLKFSGPRKKRKTPTVLETA